MQPFENARAVFEIVRQPGTDYIVDLAPFDPKTLYQATRTDTGEVVEGLFIQVLSGKPFSTFTRRDLLVIP